MTEYIQGFMRRIAAPWGLTAEGKFKRNILVETESDGLVKSVDWEVNNLDQLHSVEYYNGILIPSLTNAHCHLELSFLRGMIQENNNEGLVGFFKKLSLLRHDSDGVNRIVSARNQDLYMWKEGISAVADISNDICTFDIKANSKIRYRTFAEYYGFGQKGNVESYLSSKIGRLLDGARSLGLDISVTPHSTYLVSDAPFRYAGQMETVSIHFMESKTERDFFNGQGEMYNFINSSFPGKLSELNYCSSVDRIIKSFPPSVRLLLVHCTHIRRNEVERLMDYFNDVTFVLCPCSNLYIEGELPPVRMLYDCGCRIAIGTDSLSSNKSLKMTREITQLYNCGINLEVIFQWATLGGAKALGYQDDLGTFEVGKHSGVVLAEGIDLNTMNITNSFNIKRIV